MAIDVYKYQVFRRPSRQRLNNQNLFFFLLLFLVNAVCTAECFDYNVQTRNEGTPFIKTNTTKKYPRQIFYCVAGYLQQHAGRLEWHFEPALFMERNMKMRKKNRKSWITLKWKWNRLQNNRNHMFGRQPDIIIKFKFKRIECCHNRIWFVNCNRLGVHVDFSTLRHTNTGHFFRHFLFIERTRSMDMHNDFLSVRCFV